MTQTERKTRLQPVGQRAIAKRLEKEETLKGGILLPETAQKKQEQVEIIAIGQNPKTSDGKDLPFPVKVGDTVLMEKYAGQEVEIDGEELIILKADDIIAIIEK